MIEEGRKGKEISQRILEDCNERTLKVINPKSRDREEILKIEENVIKVSARHESENEEVKG